MRAPSSRGSPRPRRARPDGTRRPKTRTPNGNAAQPPCRPGLATLRVPATTRQVTKDEHAAAVLQHELAGAATQRPIAPPAAFAQPVLQHRVDARAPERHWEAVGADLDADL